MKYLSEKAYERMADGMASQEADGEDSGTLDIGPFTKEMSDRDYDPLAALGRM